MPHNDCLKKVNNPKACKICASEDPPDVIPLYHISLTDAIFGYPLLAQQTPHIA